MIEFYVHHNKFAIPNAWEELTPGLFEGIMADMDLVIKGELSPAMLQVKHICRAMGWSRGTWCGLRRKIRCLILPGWESKLILFSNIISGSGCSSSGSI